jgi:hypothetical protein
MKIENILKFAAIFNGVTTYFSEITPLKEDVYVPENSFYPKVRIITDTCKDVQNLPCPIDITTFVNAYNEFINELNLIIISYDNEIVKGLLECHFGFSDNLPTHKQLFKQDLKNETILLSEYQRYRHFIENLFYCDKLNIYREGIHRNNDVPCRFSRSFSETEQKVLFDGLTNGGFLPKDTNYSHFCHAFGSTDIPDNEKPFKPLKWIQTNKKTNPNPNKKALINLLYLLGLPDNEIKNRPLLNRIFVFPNGIPLGAANYTELTTTGKNGKKGDLKKPVVSEYNAELSKIVSEISKK